MVNVLNEIIKKFQHLVRDIMIYWIPGFIFSIEISLFLSFWNNSILKDLFLHPILNNWLRFSIFIILPYIIGHILYAFSCALLDFFEKKIEKLIIKIKAENIVEEKSLENEIHCFSKQELYMHFIERYSTLAEMRKNITGTFFLLAILSCFNFNNCSHLWSILLNMLISILFLYLYISTNIDKLKRIDFVNKELLVKDLKIINDQ